MRWLLFLAPSFAITEVEERRLVTPKCNPDPDARGVNVTILTTIRGAPSSMNITQRNSHMHEIMLALGENSRTNEIAEIRVLLDHSNVSDDLSTARLRADIRSSQQESSSIASLATEEDLEKVIAHKYGRQPTYADLFRYASEFLPDRVVALLNADVVLRNLHLLDHDAFYDPLALVLTLRPPTGYSACHKIKDKCDITKYPSAGASYDGFIFIPPVQNPRYDTLEQWEPNPVYMNENGAENRAKQFLSASGYRILNPCYNNLAEHWHCAPRMHYQLHNVTNKSLRFIGGGKHVPVAKDTKGIRCPPPLNFSL